MFLPSAYQISAYTFGTLLAFSQYVRVDKAIRFGYDFGIGEGADSHNYEHNRLMYAVLLFHDWVPSRRLLTK